MFLLNVFFLAFKILYLMLITKKIKVNIKTKTNVTLTASGNKKCSILKKPINNNNIN